MPSACSHGYSTSGRAGLSRDTHPSSKLFDSLAEAISKMNEGEKKALMKKVSLLYPFLSRPVPELGPLP